MNNESIIRQLAFAENKTIVVIGDFCLDKYIYSDPAEDDISVESWKPAWQIYEKKTAAGAAGTITNNLRALGVKVLCVGFLGNDGEGFDLLKALHTVGADTRFMITTDELVTAAYVKPMRKTIAGYEEDIRLDFRNKHAPSQPLVDRLLNNLAEAIRQADGVVVSDQFYERNTGTISDTVRAGLNELAGKSEIPFLVDSRALAAEFRNVFVKCNNYELIKYCCTEGDPECYEDVIAGGKRLNSHTGCPVFITRNKDGILVYDGNIREVPAYPVDGKIDVTGAGDASNAGIILGLSLGLSPADAARIACAVSSVTIHKLGETGTASMEQVVEKLRQVR